MADINEYLGTDIAHKSDFLLAPDGDLDVISGVNNVKEALLRRLVTEPGSLIHRPDYGVGLKKFQNAPKSIANQEQLAQRIQDQFLRDDRVNSVKAIRIDVEDDSPEQVKIIVKVEIKGYGEQVLDFVPFSGEAF